MSLPSFSLQSRWALSDFCWGAQVLIYPCVFLVAWGLCLGSRTWKRSRLWSKELDVSHVVF